VNFYFQHKAQLKETNDVLAQVVETQREFHERKVVWIINRAMEQGREICLAIFVPYFAERHLRKLHEVVVQVANRMGAKISPHSKLSCLQNSASARKRGA